jgi:ABC-2 type transport system permease protein
MKAAPGGMLWLLGHELRLAWYGAALNTGGKRRPGIASMLAWLAGAAMLHFFAWTALLQLRRSGADPMVLAPLATLILLTCATFMLSMALKSCVLALFERGDLDLLLSSPLPSPSIFAVRLLGVAASTAALFLYLFTPFANVALAFGMPGWLGIYVAIGACAILAACAAMLLTLALVRLLGARRTRVLAQVLAAVAGAALFLLAQAYNLVAHDSGGDFGRTLTAFARNPALGPASVLWLPGRAVLGAPLPLLFLALLAGLAFTLTVARTHRFFVHGLQQAAGCTRVAARPAGAPAFRFRASLFDTIVIKEWRLIARDPHLISQVLLQLIYLLPLALLVLRNGSAAGAAVGTGLTLLCASLTGGLAWIVISAEDAPDLLTASPAPARTIRLAKLAAAAMPPLLLVALPLLWLIVQSPLRGLLTAFTAVAAVFGAALIVLWVGRPAPRSDFKMRGKENFLCTLFELLNSLSWGALAWLLAALTEDDSAVILAGTAAAFGVGSGTLLLAWLLRRRGP